MDKLRKNALFNSDWIRITEYGKHKLQENYLAANRCEAEDGYLWFVSEILDYRELCCRKAHRLTTKERIRIFLLKLVELTIDE